MTKNFHRRARALLAPLAAAVLTSACTAAVATPGADAKAAARVTLTGVATFTDDGDAWLVDCLNKEQRTKVGAMTTGNQLYLKRRIEELEGREGKPVTAQMSGYLVTQDDKPRVLEQPALMWLSAGHCTEPDEPPVDKNQ
jgi:hypothetical protein